ncbi:NAD-dependent epimerase/dehydratase family protein [Paraliomyxa miuraensis]|uniref:NAD-dependent epimerase/dehydratase family protein n=1 Tax=Paraliomyxa miuraensis TaxID=376150 RepID=UPI002257D36C|nr:NAD-dependent epimerase/dehydratase family protein [Paraliomyxa miuraensis]MCX4243726.1 NAD-dependent epimerase/dehydratase family protein [Paraliomyxa miuraensis]
MASTETSIPQGKVFVTGGTGHVGANIVHALVAEGQDVRCLVQPGASDFGAFDGLPVETVEGDIRDYDAMRSATAGCTRVFHVAAKVSTLSASAGEQRELYEINVLGTRNVLRASLENGVARAVLTGSFSSTGYDLDDPQKPSHEDLPFYPFGHVMPYSYTKALAEHELLKCVVDGLDAVIVTSCSCIGAWDYFPSRMGRTMIDYASGKLRAFIPGGFDFVNGRDIAAGHLLAMENGRRGHKYICSTHFHTLEDLVDMFAEITGLPPVRLQVPPSLMAGITGIYAGSLAKVFPSLPQRLTPGAIGVLRMRRHADTSKAQRELGYRPGTIRDAVRDAFVFFGRQGKLPPEVRDHVLEHHAEAANAPLGEGAGQGTNDAAQ